MKSLKQWNPGTAAVLSLVIPGAGQIYKGSIATGLLWLIFVPVGYLLAIIPGITLHIICIYKAYSADREDLNLDNNAPSPATHVKCPDCRELIFKDARICRYCGCKLVPQ